MKKILTLLLALCLSVSLPACAQDRSEGSTAASTVETTSVATTVADEGIKNIVIIIGDGMGPSQVEAGQLVSGKEFSFTSWNKVLSNTNSLDGNNEPETLTDSAAGGTALATGTLTTNGRIGRDQDNNDLRTIMDHAREDYGKATGVISTDLISGATPASFSGHATSREDTETIIISQLYSDIDLLCGSYTEEVQEQKNTLKRKGYTYCDSMAQVRDAMDAEKAYWMLSLAGTSAGVDLDEVTTCALEYLSQDEDGFVLMIEQAYVDKYSHENDFNGMQLSVNSLNDTVEAVLDWIGDRDDTAIIITADHETGGLSVSAEEIYDNVYTSDDGQTLSYQWTTTGHTKTEVNVYVYGVEPDFSRFCMEGTDDVIKNTSIFDMMLDILENPLQ